MKNRNCKMVVSRKEYKCECCNKKINIGDKYLRLNIYHKGIFHFCKECEKNNKGGIMYIINEDELEYNEEEREYNEDNEIMSSIYANEF